MILLNDVFCKFKTIPTNSVFFICHPQIKANIHTDTFIKWLYTIVAVLCQSNIRARIKPFSASRNRNSASLQSELIANTRSEICPGSTSSAASAHTSGMDVRADVNRWRSTSKCFERNKTKSFIKRRITNHFS